MVGHPAAFGAAFGRLEGLAILEAFRRGHGDADGGKDVAVAHPLNAALRLGGVLASVLAALALARVSVGRVALAVHVLAKQCVRVEGEPLARGVAVALVAAGLEVGVSDGLDDFAVAAVVDFAFEIAQGHTGALAGHALWTG